MVVVGVQVVGGYFENSFAVSNRSFSLLLFVAVVGIVAVEVLRVHMGSRLKDCFFFFLLLLLLLLFEFFVPRTVRSVSTTGRVSSTMSWDSSSDDDDKDEATNGRLARTYRLWSNGMCGYCFSTTALHCPSTFS